MGYDRCLRAADDDGAASRYTMKSVEKRSKNGRKMYQAPGAPGALLPRSIIFSTKSIVFNINRPTVFSNQNAPGRGAAVGLRLRAVRAVRKVIYGRPSAQSV